MALALIGRPRLLAVDDTDLKLSDAEREPRPGSCLLDLTREGLTVVAAGDGAPADALTVSTARTDSEAADPTRHRRPGRPQTHEEGAARCARRNWPRLS